MACGQTNKMTDKKTDRWKNKQIDTTKKRTEGVLDFDTDSLNKLVELIK